MSHRVSQPSPLYGREAALGTLSGAVDEAMVGRGRMVFVTGEPGIGKSALVDAASQRAAERGATVLFGRAWELGEAPAYFPLWSGLRALGLEPPQRTPADPDAFHLWERVLAALHSATREKPILWVLEDLHAADRLTLDLVAFLARPVRALPVVLMATARDRDPGIAGPVADRLARLARDGAELRLDPLSAEDSARLAESIVGHQLNGTEAQRLVELTSGNPLYLIECARTYRAANRGAFPATIRTLVEGRVQQLPQATREALIAGAIVGRGFTAALVARMLGPRILPAQIIERLTPAVRAGFLGEPHPGRFLFSHILVRDAIEDSVGPVQRAALHAAAGAALTGDTSDVLVERARHALASGSPESDAVALSRRAAETLAGQGAFDRALAMYGRLEEAAAAGIVNDDVEPGEALRRARIARFAGRHAEARRRAEGVLAAARASADATSLAQAALEIGAELRPGTIDAGLVSALREALAANPSDGPLRCRLEARLAAALQPAEDPRQPVAMARAAIASARGLGDPQLMLEVLQTAGSALVDYAPIEERLALADELERRATAAADTPRVMLACARAAMDHVVLGDFAAFAADVGRLRDASLGLGHPRWRWRPLLFESMRAIAHGELEESERALVEVRELADLSDDPALTLTLGAHTMMRAFLFRRDDELKTMFAGLEQRMDDVPDRENVVTCMRAAISARLGDREGTARALARLRIRPTVTLDDFRYMLIEAWVLAGTEEERRRLHAALLPDAGRHFVSGHIPMTYDGPVERALGLLESSLGDHESARVRLDRALAGAEARGHALWVAELAYNRGTVLDAAGRASDAAGAFRQALSAAERVSMSGLVNRLRARLEIGGAGVGAAPPPPPEGETMTVARDGDVWRVAAGARSVHVRPNRGLELLARLVQRPGEEVHVLALVNDAGGALLESTEIEGLDARARSAYQERLRELGAEIEEAEAAHDLHRRARLAHEREALMAELGRAVGLHGRARPIASATERARVNAQRRLKEAVARIAEADPVLGQRFAAALHTGTYCCFRP